MTSDELAEIGTNTIYRYITNYLNNPSYKANFSSPASFVYYINSYLGGVVQQMQTIEGEK